MKERRRTGPRRPQGRLKLLETKRPYLRDVVPKVVAAAPGAVLLVVTDRPDRSPTRPPARPHTTVVLSIRHGCSTACACVSSSPLARGRSRFGRGPSASRARPSEVLSGRRPAGPACRSPRRCGRNVAGGLRSGSSTTCVTQHRDHRSNEASQFRHRHRLRPYRRAVLRDERTVRRSGAGHAGYGRHAVCRAVVGAKASAASLSGDGSTRKRRFPRPKCRKCFASFQRITYDRYADCTGSWPRLHSPPNMFIHT